MSCTYHGNSQKVIAGFYLLRQTLPWHRSNISPVSPSTDMSCVTGYTVKVLPAVSKQGCGLAGVGASYLVRPVSTTTPSCLTMSLSVFKHLLFIVFSSQNTTEFTVYGTDGARLLDSCLYTVQVCTPFAARM